MERLYRERNCGLEVVCFGSSSERGRKESTSRARPQQNALDSIDGSSLLPSEPNGVLCSQGSGADVWFLNSFWRNPHCSY